MKTVTEFPRRVRELHHVWIPMADGVSLAARIWLPEDAEAHPVPAILEYIPYRKRDLRTFEDEITHPYLAGHGYAGVRVDIRGSGDSEGVLTDEYTPQELADGVAIIDWLARQPWCDGNVGMLGISWGGFNGLQIAALQPRALKAVVTVCSTDDRYADDVHYMGGCMLLDNLSWSSIMFANNSCPPDPETVGEQWRELWLQRLQDSGLWLESWSRHQRRDPFWEHGSVCEDYSAIRCPVFAVSGWADGYSNAVFRLLEHLEVPRKGLVGPWSHRYPHLGEAGPAIGFLEETLRWWDHWLKGRDTGIMDEPMVRAWMLDAMAPRHRYEERLGRWVGETAWPGTNIRHQRLSLDVGGLTDIPDPPAGQPLRIRSPLRVGLMAGKWCSYADGPDLPGDQREDDAGSLVFDTGPLDTPLEILGAPVVELTLSADRPVAMVAVRLNDVQPDGQVARVSYGLLNLTHRNSHARPEPLVPGERYRVRVQLNDIAQRFPAGHRIRLAVSGTYWPLAWPPPERTTLALWTGASALLLPVRAASAADADLHALPAPAGAVIPEKTEIEPPDYAWRITRELEDDSFTLEVHDSHGVYRLENVGTEIEHRGVERYRIRDDDSGSARGETRRVMGFRRGDWQVRTITETVMTADALDFHITATLDAEENGRHVFHREWDVTIPRDNV
ncbi:MAG TPA: CocE/NonD family hydrolase [Gammaproteobacteria bacterium]|nr:CocE/NonD family hydrolase [Gammaproteobacteria bacterium]